MSEHMARQSDSILGVDASDKAPARVYTLSNLHGMTISVMDIGATWLSCVVPMENGDRDVLLRAASLTSQQTYKAYLGSVIGRFANRINRGKFTLKGKEYKLSVNDGRHCLHGGNLGFDRYRWNVLLKNFNKIVFAMTSRDGDQGFPGRLDVQVTYEVTDDNEVIIDYKATSDMYTPVNLTNHAYFNLAGEASGESVMSHTLKIEADHYLPVNNDLTPTGGIEEVTGTGFDFRQLKEIGADFLLDENQKMAGGYDHCFILKRAINDGESDVVTLVSPNNDLTMKLQTTKPAVQLYTGNFLEGVEGVSGVYKSYSGLCLETQYLPDGPNHPEWGRSAGIIGPGEHYSHATKYSFEF
ncbi:galactose-1-epimerase [Veronia pacifica]|uniref:Aldose 1-epimerase n=1 Tax=Veronia pacifica TaxID=1080227 RepID=A0A1C3EL38_9GAMM|nr:galactose-1-epimerase [Veronia pacifica]ODA33957.1 galactose-1-epimerase [Veronia pacifica]